jgi:hypothetical protein
MKKAPSGASVSPMDKFEKAIDDDPFFRRSKKTQDQKFGRLVQDEHRQGDGPQASIRSPVHRV